MEKTKKPEDEGFSLKTKIKFKIIMNHNGVDPFIGFDATPELTEQGKDKKDLIKNIKSLGYKKNDLLAKDLLGLYLSKIKLENKKVKKREVVWLLKIKSRSF